MEGWRNAVNQKESGIYDLAWGRHDLSLKTPRLIGHRRRKLCRPTTFIIAYKSPTFAVRDKV